MCQDCFSQRTRIVVGRVVIDLGALRVARGRRSVRLTAAEAALLFILVAQANELVRIEDLVALLHRTASFAHARARIKFVIVQLRKKLGSARRHLETVHGRGYVFNLAAEKKSGTSRSRKRRS
jgi:DNA-binding response OmpR family regulator